MKNIKLLIGLNTMAAGACSSCYLLWHTVFSENWKNAVQLKIDDVEIPVPKKLNVLISEVMNEMKFKNEEKSFIKPFILGGLDLKYAGYSGSKPGVFLGIPQYFLFDVDTDINVTSVVNDIELPPDSPESQIFKTTFCLSQEAKKFAIANGIQQSKHSSFFFLAALPFIVFGVVNCIFLLGYKYPSTLLKKLTSLFQVQFLLFGIWFYCLIYDFTSVYKEAVADFQVANLGVSYTEGGIEYYEKMILRNKTLKKLNKNAPYTIDGDINDSWIRTTHMPLPNRINYLKDIMTAFNKNEKKPSVWDYVFIMDIIQK